ncbi:hypothetical protein C8A00DRAFT_46580 [Chaetomidium leptoderma]|uniref:Uncharacterized protein n=1 Tax=Chaetomidium leptoderma TaxID=669021 RepID=A0AAN6VEC1_9PEZI|nr:hypothetical protein C8A00DRAFT_46580 [Chaetomidium leptoderma]
MAGARASPPNFLKKLPFEYTFLDERRVPETPPPPQNPLASPPKKTRPLAASAQPAEFYSQYQCPICGTRIADEHGANFIGHGSCLHRGTCTKPECIHAYYGTDKKWASPYKGCKTLYCQAAGCGKQIEEWCFVEAKMWKSGKIVFANHKIDPEVERAYYSARNELFERKDEEKAQEGKPEMKKESKEKKRKERKEKKSKDETWCEADSLTGSRFWDNCLMICCFPCIMAALVG